MGGGAPVSRVGLIEPVSCDGVGAFGVALLQAALQRAGHSVVRVQGEASAQGDLFLPRTPSAADVDAWFVSCLFVRQWIYLPALFRALGLAPLATDRKPGDPLVAFGGQSMIAPAALQPFADVLALGDGELTGPIIAELVGQMPKADALATLAGRRGFYVPALARPESVLERIEAPGISPVLVIPGGHHAPTIEAARGCRRKCAFCSLGWAGGTYREATPEMIEPCLKRLVGRRVNLFAPEYAGLSWVDRAEEMIAEYGLSHAGRDARFDSVSALLARGARPRAFSLGLDGVSERVRYALGKPIAGEVVAETMDALRDVPRVRWYVIIGMPGETDDDRAEFVALLDKCRVVYRGKLDITLTHFQAVPHTPLGHEDNHYREDAAAWGLEVRARLRSRWQCDGRPWLASEPKGRQTHEFDAAMQRAPGAAAHFLLRLKGRVTWIRDGRWRDVAADTGWDIAASLGEQGAGTVPWRHVKAGDAGAANRSRAAYWRRLAAERSR